MKKELKAPLRQRELTGLPRSLTFARNDDKVRSTLNELTTKRTAFTMAARLSRFYNGLACLRSAFTMAEILLSLTIIGVVAAITLPSLTGNINERTWNTQRKALYARMSQAIALMPALNGYGSTVQNRAETFITNGLSKVLKINNICGFGTDGSTLYDCGLPEKIVASNGTKIDLPTSIGALNIGAPATANNKAAAFETANGESILTFYNQGCTAENVLSVGAAADGTPGYSVKQHVCANFMFDLNGKKGPNTVGKDIGFISVVYSSDSKVVMPMYPKALSGSKNLNAAASACNDLDEGQYRLPNIEELLSIYYNKYLLVADAAAETLLSDSWFIWSSTAIDSSNNWGFGQSGGIKYILPKTRTVGIVCVQR